MSLILTEIKRLTAEEEIKCEASEIYWSLPRPLDYTFATLADAILLFQGRFGKIRTGDKYLKMLFVDEDGEQFEFNCLESINKLNFRNSYYPDIIQEALIEYRKNYRIKQTQHGTRDEELQKMHTPKAVK